MTFESEGRLSSKYGIAENGIVTVTWTPSMDNDMLKAVLYNEAGKVIKEAVWGGNDAVDLGLSVKWAPQNLGASVPEEIGDFLHGQKQLHVIPNIMIYLIIYMTIIFHFNI